MGWLRPKIIYMHDAILEKLKRELEKDVVDECQVVFVLSRIRKYLERCEQKSYHEALKFYCDWVLHTRIHNTKRVENILLGNNLTSDSKRFDNFEHFASTLDAFLQDNGISNKWIYIKGDSWEKLKCILFDIYSDTPLFISSTDLEEELTINKSGSDIILNIT